jgi:transcriptional regulator with XRE-family HTH domain
MEEDTRRNELKAFLRARRAAVTPEDVGIPRGPRRLTPGLRREEVADAAGVGLTWYTWLEQGRDIHPSAATLRRIATVLRLNDTELEYLFALAGVSPVLEPSLGAELPSKLLPALELYKGPAAVLDAMWDLLAANRIAHLLWHSDKNVGPYKRNQLWQIFMNPERRRIYPDFEETARNFVAIFRRGAGALINNPEYRELVMELTNASADFARIWCEQHAAPLGPHAVTIEHPDFGRIEVVSLRMPLPSVEGSMMVLMVPGDDATAESFAKVAARIGA